MGTKLPALTGTKAMKRPRDLARLVTKLPSAPSELGLEENWEPMSQGRVETLEPWFPATKEPRRLGTKFLRVAWHQVGARDLVPS